MCAARTAATTVAVERRERAAHMRDSWCGCGAAEHARPRAETARGRPGTGMQHHLRRTPAARQAHTHSQRQSCGGQPCELRGEEAEHSLLLHGDAWSWQGWALWAGIGGSLQEERDLQELYDRSVVLRCCSKQNHHKHRVVRMAEGISGEFVSAGGSEGDEATIVWRDEGKRGGDVMSTTLPSARVKGHLRSSSLHVFIHRLTLTPCQSSNMHFVCK